MRFVHLECLNMWRASSVNPQSAQHDFIIRRPAFETLVCLSAGARTCRGTGVTSATSNIRLSGLCHMSANNVSNRAFLTQTCGGSRAAFEVRLWRRYANILRSGLVLHSITMLVFAGPLGSESQSARSQEPELQNGPLELLFSSSGFPVDEVLCGSAATYAMS